MEISSKPLATLVGHEDRVWDVAWNPSGSILASCGGDKTIRIWGLSGSEWICKGVIDEGHNRTVRRISWSPDGKYLASASFDSTICIWEFTNGEFECVATLEGHENEVKSVSWDASGSLLATCSRDKSVWIWEMEADNEFECLTVLHGHSQDVKSVLWHPSNETLFSCSYDDTIKVWEEEDDDWYCTQSLAAHTSTVWDMSFNRLGDKLVSAGDDKNLIIWDTSNLREVKKVCTLTGFHTRTIYSVSWSANGHIASGGADDTIRLFKQNPEEKEISMMLITAIEKAHDADINCVRWNPTNPSLLASCSDDHTVKLWTFNS